MPTPSSASSTSSASGSRPRSRSPGSTTTSISTSRACRAARSSTRGCSRPGQVGDYFADDLGDPLLKSAICMFHSRFSTNTFPSWQLAHPYRMISHNGEINTLRGNINWMRAREALFASELYEPGDVAKIKPIIREGLSDTACLDNAVELLVRSGYSLPHAMMMLIPEAWENHETMSQVKKDFYAYHSCLMEPWDGPASVAFTDGKNIGAVLDRNGLRPSRYVVTKDDRVIMASEVGRLQIAPENVAQEGAARAGQDVPGRPRAGPDHRRRGAQARRSPRPSPTASGSASTWSRWPTCRRRPTSPAPTHETLLQRQQAFGYTLEDLKFILAPDGLQRRGGDRLDGQRRAAGGALRPGPAALQLLQAALRPGDQPAARRDPRRAGDLGLHRRRRRGKPAGARSPNRAARSRSTCRSSTTTRWPGSSSSRAGAGSRRSTLPMLFVAAEGAAGMERALESLFEKASAAIEQGASLIILSDRGVNAEMAPIPSLLACSGLHHHLVRQGLRSRAGLLIECGDAREVHHFALLLGYGAGTINPYVAFETLDDMIRQGVAQGDRPRGGGLPLPQGDQEGRRQGDVQDGHQHDPELSRRPDLRGHRPATRNSSAATSTRPPRGSAASASTEIARETLEHHHRAYAIRDARPGRCSRKAASTSGGATASTTCSTPRRSSGSSTPPRRAGTTSSRSTPRWSTSRTSGSARCAGCSSSGSTGLHAGPDRGGRAGRVDRQAVRHRRDELRLDLGRGARDAGHRHEPAGGQVEHRRRGRGPRAVQAAAQRRQQAERDQAGGLGPVRRDQRIPGERRRAADQDGAGRQARRGGPASRPQGLALDRQGAATRRRASA